MLRHFFDPASDSLDLSIVTCTVSSVLHCLRVTRTHSFHQTLRFMRDFEEGTHFANFDIQHSTFEEMKRDVKP
jgi:hypothetical protein